MPVRIPTGWVKTTLGEVNVPSRTKALPADFPELPFVGMEHIESKTMRLLGRANAGDVRSSCAKFNAGDVLYGKMRPYLNKVWCADFDGLCSTEYLVFPKAEGLVSQFLAYRLNSDDFVSFANHQVSGDRPRVDFEKLAEFPYLLPPTREQERIVAKLDALLSRLSAGEAAARRALDRLQRYRAAVLHAAVTGELLITKKKRVKPPELPAGWYWSSLKELKARSMYGPRFSSEDYSDTGYIVLRTTDINEGGKVDTASAPKLPLVKEEAAKYKVERGDLLITRTGSLGTLAVFDDDVDAIPGAYLIHYRLAAPQITSKYIFYFLKSPTGQRALLRGGAGVGRPNLNAPTIEAIPIPLPPVPEQEQIVAAVERRLVAADRLRDTITRQLDRVRATRQSLLREAFAGKLVPQVTGDEPASALLDRIQAGRERVRRSSLPMRTTTHGLHFSRKVR